MYIAWIELTVIYVQYYGDLYLHYTVCATAVRRDFSCVLYLLPFTMRLLTLNAPELGNVNLPHQAAFFYV